jgi:hypothetical protein
LNPIFACTSTSEDWQQFLAEPERQWRTGFSARTLAHAWQTANGFPAEVESVVRTSTDLAGADPLIGIPEYRIPLPGGERASQSDILVLGRATAGAFAMVVEGKVSESFGPRLGEWLDGASSGKQERWRFLCAILGIDESQPPDMRYQLFHRSASALLAARLHHSPIAVLLVHSFGGERAGFADFAAFLKIFNVVAVAGTMQRVGQFDGTHLLAAWVNGDARHLSA